MVRHSFISLIFAGITVLFFSCESDDSRLEFGINRELAQFRKESYSNIQYQYHFNIPSKKSEPINGSLVAAFDIENNSDIILDFDANDDQIKKILLNEDEVNYRLVNNHILIPKSEFSSNEVKIEIEFVAGNEALNRHDEYLYTLFVPARASTSIPLFDQPDLKANYELSLTIPKEWNALSNGAIKKETYEEKRKLVEFDVTLPISSYLFAFTAGKYDVITQETDFGKMRMYHRETDSLKLSSNIDNIFQWHIASLKWLEEYTSIDYPFKKFDFALIPSFQYGGMEHPGAVFYKASSLFLEESATISSQLGRGRLIAHETAHMWFGDLVTMSWFDDVWLKEVFANFIAAKIINPEFPNIDHKLQFLLGHYPAAYSVDRTEGTHPIAQELGNLYDAGSLYGSIIYQKAPIVMRMLEERIGEEAFQNGIKKYLSEYSFGNASWDDLISIMSQETDQDLDYWDKVWVKKEGMPRVVANVRDRKSGLRVNLFTTNAEELIWEQELEVILGQDSLNKELILKINTDERIKRIKHDSLFVPDYAFLNGNGKGYGYFKMGNGTTDYYLKSINEQEDILRAALWVNFHEAVLRADLKPYKYLNELLTSIPQEQNPLILDYLTKSLVSVYWTFLLPEERNQFTSKVEGVLFNTSISSDNESIRAACLKAFYRTFNSPEGIQLIKNLWTDRMDIPQLNISENDYTSMAYELMIRIPDLYDSISEVQETRITNNDRKERFLWVRQALSNDENKRDTFFNSLKELTNRSNEPWVIEALSYLHHPLRQKSAVKYITPSLEMIEEIKSTGDIFFPKRWLDATFNGHQSEEAADLFRNFMYQNHNLNKDLKNKVLQASDILLKAEQVHLKYAKMDGDS